MTDYIATIGLIFLFAADYVGIIVWLLRTADIPNQTIRFSVRSLFLAVSFLAIHFAAFAAFLHELSPHVG